MSPTNDERNVALSDFRSQRFLRLFGMGVPAVALVLLVGYLCARPSAVGLEPGPFASRANGNVAEPSILTSLEPMREMNRDQDVPHPLDPALQLAREGLQYLRRDVADYTATVVKRELVDRRIVGPERMQLKVRCGRTIEGEIDVPYSIYLKFLAPKSKAGREVIWVENQNRGNLVVHESGFRRRLGRLSLKPQGLLAMRGQRYPIQCIGFDFLVGELIRRGERDRMHGDCEVEIDPEAALIGRPCTKIEVRHSVSQPHFDFSLARIFVDQELGVPIHYTACTWPSQDGGRPVLLEEYTYLDVQLNVGLTDADFDPDNPAYDFP